MILMIWFFGAILLLILLTIINRYGNFYSREEFKTIMDDEGIIMLSIGLAMWPLFLFITIFILICYCIYWVVFPSDKTKKSKISSKKEE